MPTQENEPLLPAPVTQASASPSSHRSKLNARRTTPLTMSAKSKGKQRAVDQDDEQLESLPLLSSSPQDEREEAHAIAQAPRGRHVTIIFSGEGDGQSEGNLELWVENGESVGAVKEQIRHLRSSLASKSLRLIHSGRLLTDGILLLAWLRSLEERVKRQAGGVGGDVESVLKDVGLAEEDELDSREKKRKDSTGERAWLHCVVGAKVEEKPAEQEDEPSAPRRRGFDVLLDAGLSPDDVAQMRRQFYESRGEEVPDDLGDTNDEHARALEEQWIEGDMTADTATTTSEGMFSSILHGLLTGFLFPFLPYFFFRELPLPNFFDADAEANGAVDSGGASARVAEVVGGEVVPSIVFGKRMQIGIFFGTILNLAFGALRFLN